MKRGWACRSTSQGGIRASLTERTFLLQELPLPPCSPIVSPERAIRPHDAVAGDARVEVCPEDAPDRARGMGAPRPPCDFPVREHASARDACDDREDAIAEWLFHTIGIVHLMEWILLKDLPLYMNRDEDVAFASYA